MKKEMGIGRIFYTTLRIKLIISSIDIAVWDIKVPRWLSLYLV